ncbi:hypothetical protein EL17_19670 [Anditalea andensis]|uniref:Outer membrane protein beta-barrel domain-containing protein n=2 Tax=Anditalea andensis TaxID=1048983 RepID=A0A074KQC5_9BACT|nr:hypothetical protein EL17_19670 [Anditalea andensis]
MRKIGTGIFVVWLFQISSHLKAQTTPDGSFEAGFKGMAAISFTSQTVAINIGGPHLDYRINKDLAIGVGAFPSLFFSSLPSLKGDLGKNIFEPKLGLSPRLDFKNIVLIAPVYHFSSPDRWLWTFGIGIKIP